MDGTKPMKLKKEAAMKMKKAAMQLKKEEAAMKLMKEKESAMKMGHSPKKANAKPDFLDIDGDGNETESMKKAAADKKNPAMQMKSAMKMKKGEAMKMKKDDAAMKMGHSPKKMAKNAMKMKSPMKNENNKDAEKKRKLFERKKALKAEVARLKKEGTDAALDKADKIKFANPSIFGR